MHRVFIDGKEGTTGLRIYERMEACPDIELLLLSDTERKAPEKRREMIHASDLTILCLPDAAAREAVQLAAGSRARIIDASTAHRTAVNWCYGFAELNAAQTAAIQAHARVAVPGCHASGFIALIAPLLQAGLLSPDVLLTCTSLTGYSGGGKPLIATYRDPQREEGYASPRPYALGQAHKHLPEMQAITGLQVPPVFTPILGDFYSGMLLSIPLHSSQLRGAIPTDIRACYKAHYQGRPLITVHTEEPIGGALCANALSGSDAMHLYVAGTDARYNLIALYDNLGKGASGAAIQCLNLMLGRPETAQLCI